MFSREQGTVPPVEAGQEVVEVHNNKTSHHKPDDHLDEREIETDVGWQDEDIFCGRRVPVGGSWVVQRDLNCVDVVLAARTDGSGTAVCH